MKGCDVKRLVEAGLLLVGGIGAVGSLVTEAGSTLFWLCAGVSWLAASALTRWWMRQKEVGS